MDSIEEKKQNSSSENPKKEISECNQKINKYIKFPTLTWERIIKLIVVTLGTIFMIVAFFTGIAYSRHDISCIDDVPHIYTESINNFFFDHEGLCMALKFILSFIIDVLIIYTLIVWSLFGSNSRLIASGCVYMIINLLIRFIHIQIQPNNSAFTKNHIFSFFVNYQISTYSFYSVTLGILVICAFEWKRNNVNYMFWVFFGVIVVDVIFLVIMRGNYWHEIFTSILFGHYFFMMTEKILELIYGEKYLKNDINFNMQLPIMKNSENADSVKGNELKETQGDDSATE